MKGWAKDCLLVFLFSFCGLFYSNDKLHCFSILGRASLRNQFQTCLGSVKLILKLAGTHSRKLEQNTHLLFFALEKFSYFRNE
jgi:hypothetical protein